MSCSCEINGIIWRVRHVVSRLVDNIPTLAAVDAWWLPWSRSVLNSSKLPQNQDTAVKTFCNNDNDSSRPTCSGRYHLQSKSQSPAQQCVEMEKPRQRAATQSFPDLASASRNRENVVCSPRNNYGHVSRESLESSRSALWHKTCTGVA